jgi:hypothetical protein
MRDKPGNTSGTAMIGIDLVLKDSGLITTSVVE